MSKRKDTSEGDQPKKANKGLSNEELFSFLDAILPFCSINTMLALRMISRPFLKKINDHRRFTLWFDYHRLTADLCPIISIEENQEALKTQEEIVNSSIFQLDACYSRLNCWRKNLELNPSLASVLKIKAWFQFNGLGDADFESDDLSETQRVVAQVKIGKKSKVTEDQMLLTIMKHVFFEIITRCQNAEDPSINIYAFTRCPSLANELNIPLISKSDIAKPTVDGYVVKIYNEGRQLIFKNDLKQFMENIDRVLELGGILLNEEMGFWNIFEANIELEDLMEMEAGKDLDDDAMDEFTQNINPIFTSPIYANNNRFKEWFKENRDHLDISLIEKLKRRAIQCECRIAKHRAVWHLPPDCPPHLKKMITDDIIEIVGRVQVAADQNLLEMYGSGSFVFKIPYEDHHVFPQFHFTYGQYDGWRSRATMVQISACNFTITSNEDDEAEETPNHLSESKCVYKREDDSEWRWDPEESYPHGTALLQLEHDTDQLSSSNQLRALARFFRTDVFMIKRFLMALSTIPIPQYTFSRLTNSTVHASMPLDDLQYLDFSHQRVGELFYYEIEDEFIASDDEEYSTVLEEDIQLEMEAESEDEVEDESTQEGKDEQK